MRSRKRKRAEVELSCQDYEVPLSKTPKLNNFTKKDFSSEPAEDEEISFSKPEIRRSPNGYILPPPFPPGMVVTDNDSKKWKILQSIGIGGFGEIYSAVDEKGSQRQYVIKVEPHTNGPLFVEINFYIRSAKSEDLTNFKRTNRMKHLGIPDFVASGSFDYMNKKYRFLVLPKFGNDLEKISELCGGYFGVETASNLSIQVLNCLEYIHSCGFVHKDIKGSNLLLDLKNYNRVYLVDFGLVTRYSHNGIHNPYIEAKRWAHEGTLEYTSRDAHVGCPSRRGDIEVLFYNMIEWLGGLLPWDHPDLQKPNFYYSRKIKAFEDPKYFLYSCFGEDGYPDFLYNFMKAINSIGFNERPNYEAFKDILSNHTSVRPHLIFEKHNARSLVTLKNGGRCSNSENVSPNNLELEINRSLSRISDSNAIFTQRLFVPKISDQEYEAKKYARTKQIMQDSWKNPTEAMIKVLEEIKARRLKSKSISLKKLPDFFPTSLTPAMEAVLETIKLKNKIESRSSSGNIRKIGTSFHQHKLSRELSSLGKPIDRTRKITRSHSVPNTDSMTTRSLRKQVRDAFRLGLGNLGGFLKSLYPFKKTDTDD